MKKLKELLRKLFLNTPVVKEYLSVEELQGTVEELQGMANESKLIREHLEVLQETLNELNSRLAKVSQFPPEHLLAQHKEEIKEIGREKNRVMDEIDKLSKRMDEISAEIEKRSVKPS